MMHMGFWYTSMHGRCGTRLFENNTIHIISARLLLVSLNNAVVLTWEVGVV
jgi:hypothetical protein